MQARSTEINIWDGNLQERFTAAAVVPGWMSAWVNLQGDRCLGNGQMLKNRAGVPGPGLLMELSHSQVSLEHQWLTAAVALALVFKDDCAILHLGKKKCHPLLAAQSFDWLTLSCLICFTHFSWSCLTSDSWSPIFPRLSVTTPYRASRCCWPPCPGVSGSPGSSSTGAAPKYLPGYLEL